MSRVGKNPLQIPNGVKLSINGQEITVEGPKGKLSHVVHEQIVIKEIDGTVVFERADDLAFSRSIHGTSAAITRNMILGVTEGYTKTLDIIGVGYRAEQKGNDLNLLLGFSHPVSVVAPAGITLKVETPTKVSISGIDKQQVGQVAAEIRKYRRPEPYKGKGIHYTGEVVRRKQGKKSGK